jgi:dienelactone hydrolase
MRKALILALSAVLLFGAGSFWLALYPTVPADFAGFAALDAQARRGTIPLDDGDSLDAWWLPGRADAVVVLFHGYGRDHRRLWRYADALRRSGFTTVTFDFRSGRARDRKPTTLGHHELEDARAALDWVRAQPRWSRAALGVFGESLGGSVALAVAAERGDVSAVAVDAAFANGEQAISDAWWREARIPGAIAAPLTRLLGRLVTGVDPGALDVVPAARSLADRPLYFVQGLSDRRVSPDQTRDLWEAAGSDDPLWLVAGAGHNRAWRLHRRLYGLRLRRFFEHALLGRGAPLPGGELTDPGPGDRGAAAGKAGA